MKNDKPEGLHLRGYMWMCVVWIGLFFLSVWNAECLGAAERTTQVLAVVNGETIDEQALHDRVRAIHRQKSGIRPDEGAGSIAIGEMVENMIDERLMMQEARHVELDKTPEFSGKMASFVTTQSVLRLRQEEVMDRIDVGEEDIVARYQQQFEDNGQQHAGRFERVKGRIEKNLKKEQEKTLSDDFVAQLRRTAEVWVDSALVESVDPEQDYPDTTQAVARVDGEAIPFAEFLADLKRAVQRQKTRSREKEKAIGSEKLKEIKKNIVDRLVTYRLIEQEALKRNYMKDPVFADMVERRKSALLVDAFKAKLVHPLASPTDQELARYYEEHIDRFKEGYEVWIREMRFHEEGEAKKILNELRQGASFEFLEAQISGGMPGKDRTVWVPVDRFAPVIRTAVNGLSPGEVSDVISHGRKYKIIKLKGKRGGTPVAFSEVEDQVKRMVGQEKFEKVLADYLARLRKASRIKIHEKALEDIAEKYWRGSPEETETVAPHSSLFGKTPNKG